MADVVREGNQIALKLPTGERIMAMHNDGRWLAAVMRCGPVPC